MKLNFTGRGAMLYPEEGNTAAYFESENAFFLIDCGEDVAAKLIADKKLTKEKEYYLMITHTHSDHIGSLGTLQQYLYWCCGKKLNIVTSKQMRYRKEMQGILDGFGLVPETYEFVNEEELDNKFKEFSSIRFVRSNHGDVPIASCAIIISVEEGNILYTGDIADSTVIKEFIVSTGVHNIDRMYIDTSLNKSPVHLSLEELLSVIPIELRSRVYCMHINDRKLLSLIEESGLQVVHTTSDVEFFTDEELNELSIQLEEELEKVQTILNRRRDSKKKVIS